MKNSLSLIFLFFLCACTQNNIEINPSAYLSPQEDSIFKYSIIRYAGKLPPKSSHSIKFDPFFDPYYIDLANSHKLDFYYPSKDGKIYFQLSRIAPSLKEKYVGIGGIMEKDSAGEIVYYEELYRTWKMPYDELLTVSNKIFTDMIKGKSLEKYYTANTPDDVYIIEFPDENTYFDTKDRIWKTKNKDVLEEFEEERSKFYEKKFMESSKQEQQ
ncbi:MAG: hypothetical protein ACK4KT_09045 [Thermaurantimonas sp.]